MLKRSAWPVILQIIPELSTGGAERTAIEVAEAISMAGGKALVLSEGGRLEDELADAGGELIRFPAKSKNPAQILYNSFKLMRVIKDHGVSLVHARSRAPAWSAFLAARAKKRPFVTTYHGIYNQRSTIKAFYNGVMARGDAVICNSRFTCQVVRERHPSCKDLYVIYRGVDTQRFDPAAVEKKRVEKLRHDWGIGSAERVVLVPARLTWWKGHHSFIEAANLLEKMGGGHRNVVYVLAGDDQGRTPYRAELEGRIRELGLSEKFRIVGHCDDMPAAFLLATVTVIPSIEAEAFGRVSIEAQAMGCPVVASNIGALPETIMADDDRGSAEARVEERGQETRLASLQRSWLFEPGNAAALSAILLEVLRLSDSELARMRSEARAAVTKTFSTRNLQRQTLAVYDRLLGTQLADNFESALRG